MRIGYFGGSFDPPHRGHLAVAEAATAKFALDTVLFVPAAQQPLKPGGARAPYADRLAMVSLLCEAGGGGRFAASELEAPRADGSPNYAVDTLERLCGELSPADTIFVLVGADAFCDLRRWREPERLLELAEWIVVSRPGVSLAEVEALGLSAEQRQRVHVLGGLADTRSSTAARATLKAGEGCGDSLTPAVAAYIRAHHLYGT